MWQRWEYRRHLGCPSSLFRNPWEDPPSILSEKPLWWLTVPQAEQTCRHVAIFWRGRVAIWVLCVGRIRGQTLRDLGKPPRSLAWHLSPFKMSISIQQSFDDRADCRRPRDGHILWQKCWFPKSSWGYNIPEAYLWAKVDENYQTIEQSCQVRYVFNRHSLGCQVKKKKKEETQANKIKMEEEM